MIHYILSFIGVIIGVKWLRVQFKEFKHSTNKIAFFTFNRFQSLIVSSIVILIPFLLINFSSIETKFHITDVLLTNNRFLFAVITSFLISSVWFMYIYKLDLFNKEKKIHLLLIFVFSCGFTLLAEFPYDFIHQIGLIPSEIPLKGFAYSVFGIGLVEETLKFIPFLIILFFTKAIDEPYDYILYASCSALGFSFIENTLYLERHGLEIINARALYATVAHMTFSSMIGYGLYVVKFKKSNINKVLVFLFFYFLSIFSHGFYDFWLIFASVSKYSSLTTIFFLATVHLWFIMKNNTINNSNYFVENKVINNDKLKIRLIISLVSIFMLTYVYVAFKWNSDTANDFLIRSSIVYGYIIFYLIATLSKYNLVQGVTNSLLLRFNFLIPRKK